MSSNKFCKLGVVPIPSKILWVGLNGFSKKYKNPINDENIIPIIIKAVGKTFLNLLCLLKTKYIMNKLMIADQRSNDPCEPAHNDPILYIRGVVELVTLATNAISKLLFIIWYNKLKKEIIINIEALNIELIPDWIKRKSLFPVKRLNNSIPKLIIESIKAKKINEEPNIDIIAY